MEPPSALVVQLASLAYPKLDLEEQEKVSASIEAAVMEEVAEEQVLAHEQDRDKADNMDKVAFHLRPFLCLCPDLCCEETVHGTDSSAEATVSVLWNWLANVPRIERRSCPGSAWAASLHARRNDPCTFARGACRENSEKRDAF